MDGIVIQELLHCLEEAQEYVDLDDPLRRRIDLAIEDFKFAEGKSA